MPLARTTYARPAGTFHALVGGPLDAPPLIYLHGFPDHPPTATTFLEQLARTHRVVAPWLRGYAPSPLRGPFDLDTLVGDALALIDDVAPSRGAVDVVGHDWGAVITYALCAQAPDRVRRAVTMAIPHPMTFLRGLRAPAQLRHSWYMALFQLPGAELVTRARSLALIDRLWRTWSPSFSLAPERRAALHACLADSLPAPLMYYRALLRPLSATLDRMRRAAARIEPPVLQLHGAEDGCVLPPGDADAARFADRELEVFPGLGHFLHLEDPIAVAARIDRWLR